MDNWSNIKEAYDLVASGKVARVDVNDNCKVYRAGTIIRIDIKAE